MLQKAIGKINRIGEKIDGLDLPSRLAVNNTLLIQSFNHIIKDTLANAGVVGSESPPGWRQKESDLKDELQRLQAEHIASTKMLEKTQAELADTKRTLESEREGTEARLSELRFKLKQDFDRKKANHAEKSAAAAEAEYQRGLEEGRAQFDTGAVTAAQHDAANQVQDLKEQLDAVRSAARVDRQEKDAQIESLQKLLERHEQARAELKQDMAIMQDRHASREDEVLSQDVFHQRLKRVMNGVYFGLEEELPEDASLTRKQILRGLIKVIKEQTKRALEGEFDNPEEEEEDDGGEEPPPPPPPPQ